MFYNIYRIIRTILTYVIQHIFQPHGLFIENTSDLL